MAESTAKVDHTDRITLTAWNQLRRDVQTIRVKIDSAGTIGHYTSVQTAHDAITTEGATFYVKGRGTSYGAVTLSNARQTWIMGPDSHVDFLTVSGAGVHVIFMPGCSTDGILISGDDCVVEGLGLSSNHDGAATRIGVSVTGHRCAVRSLQASTTGGSFAGISVTGEDALIEGCRITQSDGTGIVLNGARGQAINNTVDNAGNDGISLGAVDLRVTGNIIITPAVNGIHFAAAADHCIASRNIIDRGSGGAVVLDLGADNNLVSDNRMDGAAVDNGTGNEVTFNNPALL